MPAKAMDYSLRLLSPADQVVLWELLYLAIFVPAGETQPAPEVVRQPELARYVQNWGREGDLGYAAVGPKSGELLGATWLRLWSGRDKGYGYIEDGTPEISIAVRPNYRCGGGWVPHSWSVYWQPPLSTTRPSR